MVFKITNDKRLKTQMPPKYIIDKLTTFSGLTIKFFNIKNSQNWIQMVRCQFLHAMFYTVSLFYKESLYQIEKRLNKQCKIFRYSK